MDTNIEVELDGIFLHNGSYNYDSDYTYEDDLEPRGTAAVLIPLLYSIVLAIGLPGNALITLFLSLKKCWSISDIFVLYLGLTDILLLVTLPFWAAQAALPLGWCCGVFWCRICGALFNVSFYCGMLLLVCIVLERYLNITRSVQLFTQKTPRLAHIVCVLICIVSILLSIPDWFSMLYLEDQNAAGENVCSCIANLYKSKWHVASRVIHHVTFLLPVVALTVLFYFILMRLQESTKDRGKMRAVILILALVLAFTLCWAPYNTTLIVDTWRGRSKTYVPEKTALLATFALACVHACLRPLIYFALCKNFREKTQAIVRCKKEECRGDLWELGVGTESILDQSCNPDEMKQINNVEQQLQ
nr:CXCR3a1 [Bostrychus sinensis]